MRASLTERAALTVTSTERSCSDDGACKGFEGSGNYPNWIILCGEVQDENGQILAAEVGRAAGANGDDCHGAGDKRERVKLCLPSLKCKKRGHW